MIEIEILKTTMCPNCPPASAIVKRVAAEFKGVVVKETFIDKDEKAMQRAVLMDVSYVPTIIINNKIEFTGIPKEDDLRKAIKKALEK
jgi:predicted DsbA family dithiol-disulfide isomerase